MRVPGKSVLPNQFNFINSQVFISTTTRTKRHHMGWGAVNWVVFCPRIWEHPYSNLGGIFTILTVLLFPKFLQAYAGI